MIHPAYCELGSIFCETYTEPNKTSCCSWLMVWDIQSLSYEFMSRSSLDQLMNDIEFTRLIKEPIHIKMKQAFPLCIEPIPLSRNSSSIMRTTRLIQKQCVGYQLIETIPREWLDKMKEVVANEQLQSR